MTFTPILAHGGPLLGLMGLAFVTLAFVVSGLIIAFTSKTTPPRRFGVGLCVVGIVFFFAVAANFGSILRYLGLD